MFDLLDVFKGDDNERQEEPQKPAKNPKAKNSEKEPKALQPGAKPKLKSKVSVLFKNNITRFDELDSDGNEGDQKGQERIEPKRVQAKLNKNRREHFASRNGEEQAKDSNADQIKEPEARGEAQAVKPLIADATEIQPAETQVSTQVDPKPKPRDSDDKKTGVVEHRPRNGKSEYDKIFSQKDGKGNKVKFLGKGGKYQERYLGSINSMKRNFTVNGMKKFSKFRTDTTADANIDMLAECNVGVKEMAAAVEMEMVTKQNLYLRFMSEGVRWLLFEKTSGDQKWQQLREERLKDQISFDHEFSDGPLDLQGKTELLKRYMGFDSFHDFQIAALERLDRRPINVLVNSFTGSGKSLLYQFNAIISPGLTVVIAPYISIIIDQIQNAPPSLPVIALNSWLALPQKTKFLDLVANEQVKLLFITPEMFLSEFMGFLLVHTELKVSLICIDETHCAIPWDSSFRMSYLAIKCALDRLKLARPQLNTLFLTATADKFAMRFLRSQFDIQPDNIVESLNYLRANITVKFDVVEDQNREILRLVKRDYAKSKPILVFCNFKHSTEILSNFLKLNGVKSFCFHSGMTEIDKLTILENFGKPKAQNALININEVDVIITTVALSMGLNIPNIKGIVHYNFPKVIENYIQQIGRSGRNGTQSTCKVMLHQKDFYFSRGKTISDHLVSPKGIESFIKDIVENKGLYLYINEDKAYGIEKGQLATLVGTLSVCVDKDPGLALNINYNYRNGFKVKKYNQKKLMAYIKEKIKGSEELSVKEKERLGFKDEYNGVFAAICDYLAKHGKTGKDGSIASTLVAMANKLQLSIEEADMYLKEFCAFCGCYPLQDSYGLFIKLDCDTDEPLPELQSQLFEAIKSNLREQLAIKVAKIDVFYAISNYISTLGNSPASVQTFKELIDIYFKHESGDLWAAIGAYPGIQSYCPLVFIDDGMFKMVKQIFSEFFSQNYTMISEALRYKDQAEIYADCMRFVLGVNSKMFDYKKWKYAEHWGCLEHYAIEGHLDYFYQVICQCKALLDVDLPEFIEEEEPESNGKREYAPDDDPKQAKKVNTGE